MNQIVGEFVEEAERLVNMCEWRPLLTGFVTISLRHTPWATPGLLSEMRVSALDTSHSSAFSNWTPKQGKETLFFFVKKAMHV